MESEAQYTQSRSDFASQGVRCSGDLYLPAGVEHPPVVVMAHGFASERSFGLPAYAERFAGAGMAAYLFDYRCFGDSDGEPRNLVDPRRHLEDWEAAVAHVRSLGGIDSGRLALWGTSFSGGHVIVTAAKDARVKAIVAQVPFVDPLAVAYRPGVGYLLQVAMHGLWDLCRYAARRPPHYVKVVGQPDEFAIMNVLEAVAGYASLVPEASVWHNRCPARILLTVVRYRPITWTDQVRCPALVMYGAHDPLTSATSVERAASRMPNSTLVKYPFGHFQIYHGKAFEEAVERQIRFLMAHLRMN